MLLEMRCAMSISKYQVFLKTVSCGSFSKAAEAMNFTQSGISHAINSLENELGVKLLSRNRGGVVLTADGRAVLPKIEKLCAAHHSLMQTVEGLKDMDSGLVKIATFSSVSAQWLPRILKSFGKVYPNIEFEVVTGDFYDQIEDWIVNGTVDCGFLRLPSVKRLQTYALHRDELQVIVPCDHPYADRDPFPVSALAEEPFIQLEEGDDTTGTERPYGLDCSGFVDWAFYNASGGSYIPGQGGGAAAQHGQCADIPWEEVQPGDLVFYPEDDHVGIAAGRDGQGRLLVVHCAAGAGGVTLSCSNGFTQAARPGWYGEE